jgi:hypothetical protein
MTTTDSSSCRQTNTSESVGLALRVGFPRVSVRMSPPFAEKSMALPLSRRKT